MTKQKFEEWVIISKVEALVRMELNLELEILILGKMRNGGSLPNEKKLDAIDKLNYVRDALDNLREQSKRRDN